MRINPNVAVILTRNGMPEKVAEILKVKRAIRHEQLCRKNFSVEQIRQAIAAKGLNPNAFITGETPKAKRSEVTAYKSFWRNNRKGAFHY